MSLPQASRLDSGARGINSDQLSRLSEWYGLGAAERAQLTDLVKESRRRAWWQQIDLPDSYRTLLGLERAATSISEYCGSVVPGLLQQAEYGRAAILGSVPGTSDEVAEQVLDVRRRRQRALLASTTPPLTSFILDEAVLARTTGGVAVMTAQLEYLLECSDSPSTTIQIVGFEAGVHVGSVLSHFILLQLGESIPDVVYREGSGPPTDTDDPAAVGDARRHWHLLSDQALSPRDSRRMIDRYRRALQQGY